MGDKQDLPKEFRGEENTYFRAGENGELWWGNGFLSQSASSTRLLSSRDLLLRWPIGRRKTRKHRSRELQIPSPTIFLFFKGFQLLTCFISLPKAASVQESLFSSQFEPSIANSQYPDSALMQDNSMLRFFLENNGFIDLKRCSKPEFSQETDFSSAVSNQEDPIDHGPVDLGCLWNYWIREWKTFASEK